MKKGNLRVWKSDAALAGTLYKKAKPYTAMLIARCVEPGYGEGNRAELHSSKTSQNAFADMAGIASNTVGKYLRTWDAMATAGLVPARDELAPGVDVELPDMKAWVYHYQRRNKQPDEDTASELNERTKQVTDHLEASADLTGKQLASGVGPGHLAIHHRRIRDAINRTYDPEIQDALWLIMWAPEADALAALMVALKNVKWSRDDDEGRQWLAAWAEARPKEHREALAACREAQDE